MKAQPLIDSITTECTGLPLDQHSFQKMDINTGKPSLLLFCPSHCDCQVLILYESWSFLQGGLTGGISDTGSWVGGLLGPLAFFSDIKKITFWGIFIGFWHKFGTDKSRIGQMNALYHKVPYWNMRTVAIRSFEL